MNKIPLKTFTISILVNQSIRFDAIFSVALTFNYSITKIN